MTSAQTWRAAAYALMGRVAALEGQLDTALALTQGRDPQAVAFLAGDVFPQMSLDRRINLLATVDRDSELIQTTVTLLKALVRLRNGLAHSSMLGDYTDDSALFLGANRGKGTRVRLSRHMGVPLRLWMAEVERNLWRIGCRYSDLDVVGSCFGFDEN